jgi:hypothetical protein
MYNNSSTIGSSIEITVLSVTLSPSYIVVFTVGNPVYSVEGTEVGLLHRLKRSIGKNLLTGIL